MKQSELKKVLKPLIKECIKEVIFEEGVLSGIISEVVKGTSPVLHANQRMEKLDELSQATQDTGGYPELERKKELEKKAKIKLQETRKKMLDAIGMDSVNGVNIFEGTEPLKKGGVPGSTSPSSPLQSYQPEDAGVDISSIFNSRWKDMV
jgi:hypothetical protein